MNTKITPDEFYKIWNEDRNALFQLTNIGGKKESCKVVYFPINETYKNEKLINHKESRALIQVDKNNFKEVPYFYLKKQ